MAILATLVLFLVSLVAHMLDPIMLAACAVVAILAADISNESVRWAAALTAAVVIAVCYEGLFIYAADLYGSTARDPGRPFFLFAAATLDIAAIGWIKMRWRNSRLR